MNRLKIVFSLVLLLVLPKLLAQPLVKYSNDNPEYSIQWNKQFAQINALVPEIEINDKWVSVREFKNIRWEKKAGIRLSEVNNYNGKVDYLYLICENHPVISNFTIVFELVEGRPYLVMNSSLKAS